MNTPNKLLMEQARESLKGKWGVNVLVAFVYIFISLLLPVKPLTVATLTKIVIMSPLWLGLAMFYLAFSRGENPKFSYFFIGFKSWIRSMKAYTLMMLLVLCWILLLIIPGFIMGLAYSQTVYILADDKSIGVYNAIKKSRAMMKGHKLKLFYLYCRFSGWMLLSVLTLGVGFLWVLPYIQTTRAKFYEDIKGGEQSSETQE